jgi:hypothetical protein
MSIDHYKFYNSIRTHLFDGKLSQEQVDGVNAIVSEWDKRGLTDLRWLAYMLATVYWECAKTMQPIEEYGKGKSRKYGKIDPISHQVYFGRGFVQLTWKANYQKFAEVLGIDLVNYPERALELNVATQILFEGMIKGLFTGVGLPRYFNANGEDWKNARKIINGLDKAELVGGIAIKFHQALEL